MKIIDTIDALNKIEKGWALTIGNFDGVHLGHQHIIQTARQTCQTAGACGVAVMTFDPHPATLLRPDKKLGLLTPLEMREVLLEQYGVDLLIVMRDKPEIFNLSPRRFVDDFLMKTVGPRVIVEGSNFCFGYGRSGDVNTLRKLGPERGFEVIEVDTQRLHTWGEMSVIYSSTLVRNSLERGDVITSRAVLGRPYRLVGQVTRGRGVGRELGYPTANIEPGEQFVPAEGVYAGRVSLAETYRGACSGTLTLPAAFSLGRAKTFISDHPLLIEAHILDEIPGDLVGKWLGMDFIKLIRSQQRFENKQALVRQIGIDLRQVRQVLRHDKHKKTDMLNE